MFAQCTITGGQATEAASAGLVVWQQRCVVVRATFP